MATIDLLMSHGVRPANFVDVHRGANAEKVIRGIRFALNGSSQAILINCFCVLTPCDVVARGIATACKELALNVPMVVRLEGLEAEAGYAHLSTIPGGSGRSGLYPARSSRDAVLQVVDLVRGGRGEPGR
jgi:succinyl-CoA synthetase beta subunit